MSWFITLSAVILMFFGGIFGSIAKKLPTSPATSTSSPEASQFLAQEQIGAERTADATLSSGFLVPTAASLPGNLDLKEDSYEYLNAGGFYRIKFTSPAANGTFLSTTLEFDGAKGYKPDGIHSYDYEIKHKDDIPDVIQWNPQTFNFTFQGSPGIVLTAESILKTPVPTGLAEYELIWDDGGNADEILLSGVSKTQFSPSSLVGILKTMARD